MITKTPKIVVVLINFRRCQDTIECINSLLQNEYNNFHIVVVDNASHDGSVEKILNHFPGITVLQNEVNIGFAGGNNCGIKHALNNGADYIILLNNDTIVDSHLISVVAETFEINEKAGIIGGKIFYYDQPKTIWYGGGVFNVNSGFGYHLGMDEIDGERYNNIISTDYVTGCFLCARAELFEKIGLLDETYFVYLEDVDLCTRARRAGYDIIYQPKAIVFHKVSQSSSWDSAVYIYFNLRNKIIFLKKHSSFFKSLPYFPKIFLFYARQFIRLSLKYRDMEKLKSAWYGLIDGLKNNTGDYGKGRLSSLMRVK